MSETSKQGREDKLRQTKENSSRDSIRWERGYWLLVYVRTPKIENDPQSPTKLKMAVLELEGHASQTGQQPIVNGG